MSERKNEGLSLLLFALPVVIAWVLFRFTGLQSLGDNHPWFFFTAMLVSLTIGLFLFKRARMEKTPEWHRTRALQKMKKVYAAEDKGVWGRVSENELESTVSATGKDGIEINQLGKAALAKMQGSVGGIVSEQQIAEIGEDEVQVDLQLLTEQKHIAGDLDKLVDEHGVVTSIASTEVVKQDKLTKRAFGKVREVATSKGEGATVEPNSGGIGNWFEKRRELRKQKLAQRYGFTVEPETTRFGQQPQPTTQSQSGAIASEQVHPTAPQHNMAAGQPRNCRMCGQPVPVSNHFCGSCGTSI